MADLLKEQATRPKAKGQKVEIRHDLRKGRGLFATSPIAKDEIVALYLIRIFPLATYESPTDFVYSFMIYDPDKPERELEHLIGDITAHSFPLPLPSGVTYVGPFVNEASLDQEYNAVFDCGANDKRRRVVGRYLTYSVVATTDIAPGQEILCYYGDEYPRNYVAKVPPPTPRKRKNK